MEEEAHRKVTGGKDEGMRLIERKIPLYIFVRLIRGLLPRSATGRKSISRNIQRNGSLLPHFSRFQDCDYRLIVNLSQN
jgi:hypothetical protein